MSAKPKFAHELVAQTAKEFAAAWYEEAAHDNDFYKFYPNQNKFIKREWPRFIDMAKKQLAVMLGMTTTPEWEKEQISDALIKHASIPGNINRDVAKRMIAAGDKPNVTIMPNSYGVH